jgi:hypothetical protein
VLIKAEPRGAGTLSFSTPCKKRWLLSFILSPAGGEREREQDVENEFFNILLDEPGRSR